jgi:selenium metabolism protein YedF
MSPTLKCIDAQGMPCPQPVILARKALAEGGFDFLEIRVDNAAARENLLKFAAFSHCEVVTMETEGDRSTLRLRPTLPAGPPGGFPVEPREAPVPALPGGRAATVFIASDGIGQGDLSLSRLLLRGFLFTLTESEELPLQLIFMNGGVRWVTEGSEGLGHLKTLSERGVDILACGTCLEFLKLTEALAVGRITNMYEIAGLLLEGGVLSL